MEVRYQLTAKQAMHEQANVGKMQIKEVWYLLHGSLSGE